MEMIDFHFKSKLTKGNHLDSYRMQRHTKGFGFLYGLKSMADPPEQSFTVGAQTNQSTDNDGASQSHKD